MNGQWEGGKGDKKRPSNISYEEYGNRYDKIFGKKNSGNVDRVEEASEVEVGYSDYCLFLDDVRFPRDAFLYGEKKSLIVASNVIDRNWVIVRDYKEFVFMIQAKGIPRVVSFDHDLSEAHMNEYVKAVGNGYYEWEKLEKTGLHCMIFLKEECDKQGLKFPTHYIHTANEFARKRMKDFINNVE